MIDHRCIQLLSIVSLASLLACQPEKSAPSAAAAAPAETASAESPVIPITGLKDVRFIAVPEKRSEFRWLPAEAAGDESAQAVLTAPVKGIISAPPQPAGKPVGKGAALLTLQSPELAELKSRWLQARAHLQRAEADLAREQRLADANATSQRDLEAARGRPAWRVCP